MKKFYLLILSLFFVISCKEELAKYHTNSKGSPRIFKNLPILWSFDCEFPEQYKMIIKNAFAYWEGHVNSRPLFEERKDCSISDFFDGTTDGGIGIIIDDEQKFLDKIPLHGIAPIVVKNDSVYAGLVVLFPVWKQLNNELLQESVVRHEIGHLLGLDHNNNKSCLMYKTIDFDENKKGACLQEIKTIKQFYE